MIDSLLQYQANDFMFDYILWRFTQLNLKILAINEIDDMDESFIDQLRVQITKERQLKHKKTVLSRWLEMTELGKRASR